MLIGSRYILRQISTPLIGAMAIGLLVLLAERLVRLLDFTLGKKNSFAIVFEMLAYLVPHYLGLAVPAALFLGLLFGFNKLSRNSELDAFLAAGIGLHQLVRPVLVLAGILMLASLVIFGWAQPHARYAYRAILSVAWEKGLGLWQPYFTGDMHVGKGTGDDPFPFVRTRRNIAIIGVSTAVPTPILVASGLVGPKQIHRLGELLPLLKDRGFFRVILIHHPPLPGMNSPRKALEDARAFRDVIEREGAELVLHGHNHEHSLRQVFSRSGPVQVVGVPSASALGRYGKPSAAWYCYRIARAKGEWQCSVAVRSFDEASGRFRETDNFQLDMNPAAEQPRDPVLIPAG